jgi:PadR family transcriptional regulator AphA
MSRDELTPVSFTILVLVGEGGAGPHDLVRMARQGSVYSSVAESQYYAEPKRLEKLGYLTSEKQPGKTRERTHYMLTDKGREALQEWIEQPARYPRTQSDAILRLLAADLVGEEKAVASLRAMRDEIVDLSARLDVGDAVAETLPHRRKYLNLNSRLARKLLEAHREWLDEIEQELGSPGARRTRPRGARAPGGGGREGA